jgi:hypothetical protein
VDVAVRDALFEKILSGSTAFVESAALSYSSSVLPLVERRDPRVAKINPYVLVRMLRNTCDAPALERLRRLEGKGAKNLQYAIQSVERCIQVATSLKGELQSWLTSSPRQQARPSPQ